MCSHVDIDGRNVLMYLTHTLGYIVSCRTALIDSCLCEFMIQLNHADVV